MQNNTQKQYNHYVVKEPSELLAWLIENLRDSRTKIKATLSGKYKDQSNTVRKGH